MKRSPTGSLFFEVPQLEERKCACGRSLPCDKARCGFCELANKAAAPTIPARPRQWHGDVTRAEIRTRLSPQCHALLDMLRSRPRVSNAEMAERCLKYTGRISDLRQAGYDVRCVERDRKSGLSWYTLAGEGA